MVKIGHLRGVGLICPIFNILGVRRVALRGLWPGEGEKALRNLRFF